jgi:acyl-CoA dehydrogenase
MWNSACMAFGSRRCSPWARIEALDGARSQELKDRYLEKLVSGEWMATMNLTEPQAGSDLAALRARAEPAGDGTYRIFGQKIYITYGEHDMTDNIVHLVLARLPDAPAGTRGISLFLVPKFLPDGSLGARNDVFCASIEHKLGIHASPTCTMVFGDGGRRDRLADRRGESRARLHVHDDEQRPPRRRHPGRRDLRAPPTSTRWPTPNERRQGKAAAQRRGHGPIVHHPDVQRMLLTMKAMTAGLAPSAT